MNFLEISKKDIIGFLLSLTVFSSSLTVDINFGDFNYYTYPLCITFFCLSLLHREAWLVLLVFVAYVFYQILLKTVLNYPLLPMFKQVIPIAIIYISVFYMVAIAGVERVFKSYINLSVVVSFVGIFQFFIFFIFGIGSEFGYRVSSIVTEPSHLAITIIPATIYYIHQFYKGGFCFSGIIVFICLILTRSLSVLLVFPIIFVVTSKNRWYLSASLLLLFLSMYLLPTIHFSDDELNYRFVALTQLIDGSYDYSSGQETVFSALTNANVALYSFLKTYGFGVGLGGHPFSYDIYFSNRPDVYVRDYSFGINKLNAHNLFFRGVSELGVLFLIFIFLLFYKVRTHLMTDFNIILISCLSYIIVRFVKLGGYFDHGLPLFLCLILVIIYNKKFQGVYGGFKQ